MKKSTLSAIKYDVANYARSKGVGMSKSMIRKAKKFYLAQDGKTRARMRG